jgi:hypothetical protein
MLRPIEGDGTCSTSTGNPSREYARAVGVPPIPATVETSVTTSAASAKRCNQPRALPSVNVLNTFLDPVRPIASFGKLTVR